MKNSAVSEILGAVLMVSIVITGMALIGVILFSSPPPDSIPKIAFSVYACGEEDWTDKTVMISHQGGDPIRWSDIEFIVNPEEGVTPVSPCCSYTKDVDRSNTSPTSFDETISFDETDSTKFFKTGDTLKIITPKNPHHLIIYKTSGSNQTILDTTFTCFKC